MSKDSQQAITHVLQLDSAVLQGVLGKLKQFKGLQNILDQYLDKNLAARCQVSYYENSHLIVITDNALWATQFRFQIAALITKLKLHPELSQLRNISCKIRPSIKIAAEAQETEMMPSLSPQTAEMILTAAKTIHHEGLKAILQKIATHTN